MKGNCIDSIRMKGGKGCMDSIRMKREKKDMDWI